MTSMPALLRGAMPAALLALAPAALTPATATAAGPAAPPPAAYPVIYSGAHGWREAGHARTIHLPASDRDRLTLHLAPWHFRIVIRTLAGSAAGRLVTGRRAAAVSVAAFGIRTHRSERYFADLVVYAGSATRYYRWAGRWQRGQ